MSYPISPSPVLTFLDSNGDPLSGGTLSTYVSGTSNYVQTFNDPAGTLNPSVITLDAAGRASVYLDPDIVYRFVVAASDGSLVMDCSGIYAVGDGSFRIASRLTSQDGSVTLVQGDGVIDLSVADYVTAAVGTETARAEAAEAVLGDRIAQEATDRATADTALGDRIAAEEAARIAADDALQSNIDAETTRAEAAEASARTEVVQGSNITVNKSTGADGHDIYTVTGVESVPKVEIVSTDASIGVTSSTDAGTNTKTFDLSVASETTAKNFFIGSTTLAALSDATETTIPFARSAGDFSVSSGTVTIPGTVKLVNLSLRVNIGYTGSATNIDYKKFLVKLYINETASGSWDYYADASAPAFESGSVLSHTSLLSLGASTAKTIRLTITNTDAAADIEYQAQLDLNDETFRSLGGGGSAESDHKVSVDGTDTAGYLDAKIGTEAPIQHKTENGQLVIYQDPVEASPLSLICSPGVEVSPEQSNVISGSCQYASKPAMQLHAFVLPNYYTPALTDLFGVLNTNTQGSGALSILYMAVFELDFANNHLHLVCVSENISAKVNSSTGLQDAAMHYINSAYNILKPGKFYYGGFICDQGALQIASGVTSVAFNCSWPYIGITFHNLENALTPDAFVAAYSEIDLTAATPSHQEGYTRGTLMLRHASAS